MNSETVKKPVLLALTNTECEALVIVIIQFSAINHASMTVGEVTKTARTMALGDFSAYQMRRALNAATQRGWVERSLEKKGKRSYQTFAASPVTAAACGAMYYCMPPIKKHFRFYMQDIMKDAMQGARDHMYSGLSMRAGLNAISNESTGK